jgi:hypothetical protein
MRLTSAGLLGLGTSAPQAKFEVAGDAVIGTDNVALVEFTSSGVPYFAVAADASNYRSTRINVISSGGYADLSFDAMGTASKTGLPSAASLAGSIMYLDASTQRVGIGTTGPLDSLSVTAASYRGLTLETSTLANRPTITFRNTAGSGNSAYIQGNSYEIAFGRVNQDYGGHTEAARIDSSGRLLVGTSTQQGLLTLGSGSHYSSVDPGATIKKVDYVSTMGSANFFSWRTWRSGKNYASGVSGVATVAVPTPSLLRVKIMATADGVGVRNYAYEAYVLTNGGTRTIDVIKETTLLTGGSSPAISGTDLVFTCPAATSNQSLIYVEVEQVSSQNDTSISFS